MRIEPLNGVRAVLLWTVLGTCSCSADSKREGEQLADAGGSATGQSGSDAATSSDGSTSVPPGPDSGATGAGADSGAPDDDGGMTVPTPKCQARTGAKRAWKDLNGGGYYGSEIVGTDQVKLSIFAPRASVVTAIGDFNGWNAMATPLARASDGSFSTTVKIDSPIGAEYRFSVDGRSVADLYAFANDGNRGNSIVVDRSYTFTDGNYQRPPREALVIYELNAHDFSRDSTSGVPAASRGKFAGIVQKIPYLKRLGVNAIELMPVVENQSDGYSWGYNASLFFAPDKNLSLSSTGAQVTEIKDFINAMHEAGIAVIFDVVFNHVSGQTGNNHFWGVDSLYYFDYDDDGNAEDDLLSWGYKMASWRDGVKKLIYDNLKYWMKEAHVDGFRLDSTENMDIDAVLDVTRALDEEGYCDQYFIVEEFSAEHNRRIREFNRELGRAVISSWGTSYKNRVWDAVQRRSASQTDLTSVTYYSRNDGWSRSDEVIQYASSHDEGTLNARFNAPKELVRTSAAHLLTAPGVPMIWSGEEMMRVHYGNHHPGGGGENVREANNRFDWSLETTHTDLVDYFSALIRLRIAHPTLHRALAEPVGGSFVWNNNNANNALGYIRKAAAGDRDFVVLINYQDSDQTYRVAFPKAGTWRVMAQDNRATADDAGLSTFTAQPGMTDVRVKAGAAMILMGE